jgi:hypothetical protein
LGIISAMSKQPMGRGLGSLMTDQKPQSDSQNPGGKPEIAAGVRTLMQGHNPVSTAKSSSLTNAATQISNEKYPAIPRWYFLVADALLIGLALAIAFTSPKPMPTSRMIFSIVVVILAAGCGLCALLAGTQE